MKNLKKLIIVVSLIIIVIITTLGILLFTHKDEKEISEYISTVDNKQNISLVKDESEYQDIKRIFNKYQSYINYLDYNYFQFELNEEQKTKYKEQYLEKGKEALEQILVNQVINNKKWINELSKYTNKTMDIAEMNKFKYDQLTGYLLTINYNEKESTNIIIFIDESNNSFSILPDKILIDISKDDLIKTLEKIKIEAINKNNYNEFQKIKLDDEGICLQYYYNYLDMLKNNTNKLYNTLDEKYREKKFQNSIENFNNYINDNKDVLNKAVLSKYEVNNKGNYTEYICMDESGRYYIFNAISAMNYKLFLDTYTADLPEFTEKYNSTSNQGKVALNIERVFTAINNKDYKYVYSKLADSFKSNYFNSEEEFKKFIEDNLYSKNQVEYEEFNREGSVCTYKIRVIKEFEKGEQIPEGKNAPSKYLNIVMQLNEGTDFVFSFRFV